MTITSILYPPTQPYGYLMQRPQHLMKAFASMGITVFYINPSSLTTQQPGQVFPNLYVFNHPGVMSTIKDPSVFYYSYPSHYQHRTCFPDSLVVFDSIDAPVEAFKAWSAGYREALVTSDLIIASSKFLFEEAVRYNDHVVLVPNGCDFELFNVAAQRNLSVPPELIGIRAPIIGYYGSISSWFDVELIELVANTFRNCTVVVIGPGSSKVMIPGCQNILSLGYKSYLELPHYVQCFNVGLIPFRISRLTEAVNPVKMWEYLAAGISVVSTALPEAQGLPEVYYSENQEDFLVNIAKALYQDTQEKKQERIELARKNTWMIRAETILKAIQNRAYLKHTANTQMSLTPVYPAFNAGTQRFRSLRVKNVVIDQRGRDKSLNYHN